MTIRIPTRNGLEMQKATGLLMDRNELGPAFVEWETTKGAVRAAPETVEDAAKLIREIEAAGLKWLVEA